MRSDETKLLLDQHGITNCNRRGTKLCLAYDRMQTDLLAHLVLTIEALIDSAPLARTPFTIFKSNKIIKRTKNLNICRRNLWGPLLSEHTSEYLLSFSDSVLLKQFLDKMERIELKRVIKLLKTTERLAVLVSRISFPYLSFFVGRGAALWATSITALYTKQILIENKIEIWSALNLSICSKLFDLQQKSRRQ